MGTEGDGSNHQATRDIKGGKQGFFWLQDNLENLKAVKGR